MEDYKERFNYLLKRYYNGCKYIQEHPEECEKYEGKVVEILTQINALIIEHKIVDKDVLENGFKEKKIK